MGNITITYKDNDITFNKVKFENWLLENGAQILPPTNQYEKLRFKGEVTCVIYKSGKISGKECVDAIHDYKRGRIWRDKKLPIKRNSGYSKEKKQLIKRDGTKCFYCNKELEEDITLEHLIPLSAKGPNILQNMVLAHSECNNNMGSKTLIEKINYKLCFKEKMKL